jgi:DNA-binding HxlR family transcriptional regulator
MYQTTNSCIFLPLKKLENTSSITDALNAIADKWTVPILLALQTQPMRFNELQRTLGEVTHRVLTTQLRKLEAERLVTRTVHSINPPHVVYTLAPEGSQVLPILTTLAEWQNERVAQYEASLAPAERSDIAEIAAS